METQETITRREFAIKEGFNHSFTYSDGLTISIYLETSSYYYLDMPKNEEEETYMLSDNFPHKDKVIVSDRYEAKPKVEEEMIEIPLSDYERYEHWKINNDYC